MRKNSFIDLIRTIKRGISKSPFGENMATKIQRVIFRIIFWHPKDLFTYYYKTNKWGDTESISGSGSTIKATKNIRNELPVLINELKVKNLFDAPCGDFNWFRLIPLDPGVDYIGGEIVEEIVNSNTKLYGDSNRKFILFDITEDKIPQSDIWLCRDILIHFSNKDSIKVISNLKKSDVKYFLTTTFPGIEINNDIQTGEYRSVNLEKPPFNFPAPIKYLDDSEGGLPGKKLGLWRNNFWLDCSEEVRI